MTPMLYKTRRAATPVICVNETMPGMMAVGTAPARPASRLLAPEPASAPCTWRKSTARSSRQATRCMAMEAPLA